jgi:hypothetical protein
MKTAVLVNQKSLKAAESRSNIDSKSQEVGKIARDLSNFLTFAV